MSTTSATAAATANDEETNPYLRLRATKIARNEQRLKELGLLKTTCSTIASQPALPLAEQNHRLSAAPKAPTRRSTRLSNPPLSYTYESIVNDQRRKRRRLEPSIAAEDEPRESKNRKPTTPTKTGNNVIYIPAENSVRRMRISVQDTVGKFLGRTLEKTGKAFVIESTLGGIVNASFNKYSGVQEWGNDAIYLWVNVGKMDDDVVNDFLKDGRQIIWFGGARMHDESPAILRLLKLAKQSKATPESGIILWCRHYNPDKKTYHPYTCLGRLSYESHVAGSRPLQFCWNIEDYDGLVKHENENVRARFHEIVNL